MPTRSLRSTSFLGFLLLMSTIAASQAVGYWHQIGETSVPGATAVAVSGDVAVAGPVTDGSNIVVELFVKSAGQQITTAMLRESDGNGTDDNFGNSVAINGDTVAVAADGANNSEGKIYVYVKPPGGWTNMTETAQLTASDGMPGNQMGWCVAISGDTVVAGADIHTPPGAAYVFVQPSGGWINMTQNAKLTTAGGDTADGFGFSCGVSGNTVVVGAPYFKTLHGARDHGAAYVFVMPPTGWQDMTQTARLTTASGKKWMGYSVAISENTVVAGAPDAAGRYGPHTGASYVFVKPAGHWKNTATPDAALTASDGYPGQYLGYSVSISGDTVISGAPCTDGCGNPNPAGAAYGFIKPASGWASEVEGGKILPSDGRLNAQFGYSVSVSGSTVFAVSRFPPLAYDFRYISNSGFIGFYVPGSSRTNAQGLNSLGQIVGSFEASDCSSCGFLYSDGSFTSISYPGASSTTANGINDSHQIVGTYNTGTTSGFVEQAGAYTTLNYPGATYTTSLGINDLGEIVGWYADSGGLFSDSFLYSSGNFFPIDVPGADRTFAMGINSSGEIVGFYCASPCNSWIGFTNHNGVFADVTLPGAFSTVVNGVNDNGDLAGSWYGKFPGQGGDFVYWNSDGRFAAFNIGGIAVSSANSINQSGEIVGYVSENSGRTEYGFYGHLPGH